MTINDPVDFLLPGESLDFTINAGRTWFGRDEATVIIPVSGTVVGSRDFNFAINKMAVDPTIDIRGNGLSIPLFDNTPRNLDFTNFGDADGGEWNNVLIPGTVFQTNAQDVSKTFYVHNVSPLPNHRLNIDLVRGPTVPNGIHYGYVRGLDFDTPIDLVDLETIPANTYPMPNVDPQLANTGVSPHSSAPASYIQCIGSGNPVAEIIATNATLNAYNAFLGNNVTVSNVIIFANAQQGIREGDNVVFSDASVSPSNTMFTVDIVAADGTWVTTKESLGDSFLPGVLYATEIVNGDTFQIPVSGAGNNLFDSLSVGDFLNVTAGQNNAGSYTITNINNGTREITVNNALIAPGSTATYTANAADSATHIVQFPPTNLSTIQIGAKMHFISGANIGTYTVAAVDDDADTIRTQEPIVNDEASSFNVNFTRVTYLTSSVPESVFIIKRDFEVLQHTRSGVIGLMPGEFDNFTVRFRPRPVSGDTVKPWNIRINVPSNDYVNDGSQATDPYFWFSLAGRTVFPHMSVSPENHNFASHEMFTSATQTFTISNIATGNNDLTLQTAPDYISIVGANAADFSVTALNIDDATINPGEAAQTFEITFTPTAPGARSAVLLIANNDGGNGGIYSIPLSGVGIEPPSGITQIEKKAIQNIVSMVLTTNP
ncbi:MAG: choice-of-anchor D domain-containing protein [Lentisphaeria bacterium]|nr:choice-of-anchor D domain-containing protein [Lentisphaeria bacterium]